MSSKDEDKQIIPDLILDPQRGTTYRKGRFFGKGGFAKCYEITDVKTGYSYAGKIVSKKLMTKHNQKEKITQEIAIHRSLNHKHVVGFHSFFEDENNVYIILELCRRRSMMELHKRRKALTEPEVRFYMRHILLGVEYLHGRNIIHRDLKLGNLFLNDNLEVKIGDFGLAAQLEYDGERKKTLCGTPNYIAPEILNKLGHSFEVDVWSIGCILYTLLVGKPPFETNTLKETYNRIKRCEYKIPPALKLSQPALNMIRTTLQSDPALRPTVKQLLSHNFFTSGWMPHELPPSCLQVAPRLNSADSTLARKPLVEVNSGDHIIRVTDSKKGGAGGGDDFGAALTTDVDKELTRLMNDLLKLQEQLRDVVKTINHKGLNKVDSLGEDSTDPSAQPIVWVSKWVDYSDKYGFGYQLSDDGVGVVFNDSTKLVMLPNGKNVHYITRDGSEYYYTMDQFPTDLDKKMKLLTYFRRYMSEHLVKAGGSVQVKESDQFSRIPYMHQWYRTHSAVIMHLTNGTIQVNFTDHAKLILCPLMAAATYIDTEKNFRTYRFATLKRIGCSQALYQSLVYILDKIQNMLKPK